MARIGTNLIPPLLFAYREVPQESTGFSPFELLYGRDVRGPLDVLKESWEAERRSDLNVIAYITLMRERLEEMSEHIHKNMQSAQTRQKLWYDKNARERSFQPGDQVLVLLPTSTSKLTAQWQGPYTVVERVGKVNYRIRMPDHRKKQTVFHVNMLRKWHTHAAAGFMTTCASTDKEVDDIPSWNDAEGGRASVGSQLTPAQCQELGSLLAKFEPLFQTLPGHTRIAEHRISTGDATPRQAIALPYSACISGNCSSRVEGDARARCDRALQQRLGSTIGYSAEERPDSLPLCGLQAT